MNSLRTILAVLEVQGRTSRTHLGCVLDVQACTSRTHPLFTITLVFILILAAITDIIVIIVIIVTAITVITVIIVILIFTVIIGFAPSPSSSRPVVLVVRVVHVVLVFSPPRQPHRLHRHPLVLLHAQFSHPSFFPVVQTHRLGTWPRLCITHPHGNQAWLGPRLAAKAPGVVGLTP